MMFGIGTWEIVLILVVALLLFGPKKLPELARTLGRTIHDLRRSADGVKEELSGLKEATEEGSKDEQTAP